MANGQWGGTFDQRVFRAIIHFEHGGQKCQTGFHLRDVGINTLSPEDVATEVADFATTQFRKLLHATDRITGIDAVNMETDEGHTVSPNGIVGVMTQQALPSFVQCTVSMKGTVRKRYGSGRMLWPVSTVDQLNGNALTTNAANAWAVVINDMAARYIGSSLTTSMHLVHAHKDLPLTPKRDAVPASWYDITSLRLNTTISMLRRRRLGNGL